MATDGSDAVAAAALPVAFLQHHRAVPETPGVSLIDRPTVGSCLWDEALSYQTRGAVQSNVVHFMRRAHCMLSLLITITC